MTDTRGLYGSGGSCCGCRPHHPGCPNEDAPDDAWADEQDSAGAHQTERDRGGIVARARRDRGMTR